MSFCNTFTYALPTIAALAVDEWCYNRHRVLASFMYCMRVTCLQNFLHPRCVLNFQCGHMHTNHNYHLTLVGRKVYEMYLAISGFSGLASA